MESFVCAFPPVFSSLLLSFLDFTSQYSPLQENVGGAAEARGEERRAKDRRWISDV